MAGAASGIAVGAGTGARGAGQRGAGAADAPDSFAALLQGGPASTDAGMKRAATSAAEAPVDHPSTAPGAAEDDRAATSAAAGTSEETSAAFSDDAAGLTESSEPAAGSAGRRQRVQAGPSQNANANAPADQLGLDAATAADPAAAADASPAADAAVAADTAGESDAAPAATPPTAAQTPLDISAEAVRSLEWILGALSASTASAGQDATVLTTDAEAQAPTELLRAPLQAALRQAVALSARGAKEASPPTDVSIDKPALPRGDDLRLAATAQPGGEAPALPDFARSIEQLAAALRPDGATPAAAVDMSALPAMAAASSAPVHVAPTPTPTLPTMANVSNPLLLDHPDAMADLGERILWQLDADVSEASIELHPAELGQLTVRIETRGDQAQVLFVAQEAATRSLLNQAMPQLRELLNSSGLQLTRSQVDGARRSSTDAEARASSATAAPLNAGGRRRITRVALVDAYV
ncbi:flagellar hook-length control protein FliK [Sinimarinibacterium sp. CAU 1509]|uniref:flagellar hook-length control protein FliK n=1 Tax=Sinimarinibacterium sp. CAU 1509 TaxID=2562283 RepID=UPI00200A63AA|nr:flagellar hook-length control protein FliK [Sinimarinibacterium sp. CAU 1509]